MGEVVGVFCSSHSPGMTGFPERADESQRANVERAFAQVRDRIADLAPDVIVAVSVEHFTNFFLANLPAFAVCTGEDFVGPVTAQMAQFLNVRQRRYPGHPSFASDLYSFALRSGFDPSLVAGDFQFDENFCVPLKFIDPGTSLPVVPIVVNAVNPPYPTLSRCFDFGRMLAEAVAQSDLRAVVLGTGGLSHFVGMRESGTIDAEFDSDFLNRLGSGELGSLTGIPDERIDRAGNGAHEIRTWIVAAGAAASPFEVLAYEPVSAWLTGTAVAMAVQ